LPELRSLGGPVLAAPRAMVVTFSGDANAARLESLVAQIGGSEHWRTVATEYGVGPLTAATPVRLPDTAPQTIDSAGIEALLKQKLDGAHELGKPDAGTVYVLVFPKTSAVTGALGASCTDFGGYHSEVAIGGVTVAFAVVVTCGTFLGLPGPDALEMSVAHELLEGSTDPFTVSRPAWKAIDGAHAAWSLALDGNEPADMCARNPDATYKAPFGFTVPRSWSNASAKAGHDPCVPAAAGPYFVTVPAAPDALTVTIDGAAQEVAGVRIPLGASRTIDLTLYSDEPTAAWSIAAVDESSWRGGARQLGFQLDKAQAKAGDTVHLTITAQAHGKYGVEPFLVQSTLNGRTTIGVGLVGD
jgi:hypothetical protein